MLKWFLGQSIQIRIVLVLLTLVLLWLMGVWIFGQVYDRDCRDFRTHADAQRFYHFTGGPVLDFHNLDGDDDGNACERLR